MYVERMNVHMYSCTQYMYGVRTRAGTHAYSTYGSHARAAGHDAIKTKNDERTRLITAGDGWSSSATTTTIYRRVIDACRGVQAPPLARNVQPRTPVCIAASLPYRSLQAWQSCRVRAPMRSSSRQHGANATMMMAGCAGGRQCTAKHSAVPETLWRHGVPAGASELIAL